jgi:DNA-binding CsgD family transcriptional regulator/tetratricopeptide (TPR) repeat protein
MEDNRVLSRALSPSIVGREPQLAELTAALAEVRAGRGRLLFVAGEAGVGKTRLVQEFAAGLALHEGVEVLRGSCFDEEPAEPYAPFRELLRALALARGPGALAEAAGAWAGDLARLLPDVAAPPAAYRSPEPHPEKRRLFEAIYRVIRPREPGHVAVVVLEDLHWSDQTSQELIHHLARAVEREPVLLLGTYRSEELHRRHPLTRLIAELSRERLYHELRLAPLAAPAFAGLVEGALERSLPAEFVDALYERTEGNPFFAEEVLGALVADGRLDELIAATRDRRRLALPELPLSIRDSILRRAANLDEQTLGVLRYAAVIGRRFDFDLLARLTALPEQELLRALARLIGCQLVAEERDGPEDRYAFRHELVREAVLEDLLRRERRLMHREVLLALEAQHGDRPEQVVDQLAYHSLQARELERATRYALLAGDRAVSLGAYREALAHYEVALESGADQEPAARAELLSRLGHAAYPVGDVRRCADYWREAQAIYAELGERRRSAELLRWLGRAAWELGSEEEAFALTRAALDALEGQPPCGELAMAYSALSHLFMLTSRAEESIAWGEKALALAEELEDAAVKSHALNNIGVSLCERGSHERGIAALERSLLIARENDLPLDAVRAYLNLGGQLAMNGEYRRAALVVREGIAYAERTGWEQRSASLLPKLAAIEIELGEWPAAEAQLDYALRAAERMVQIDRAYVLLLRADLLLRQGRAQAARELLEGLDPQLPRPGDCHEAVSTARLLGVAYAALGDPRRGAAMIDEAVRAWNIGGQPRKSLYQLTDAVDLYQRAGRAKDGAALLALAQSLLASTELTPAEKAIMADARGLVPQPGGLPAEHHFRVAAAQWSAMGLPLQEAQSRRRRAATLLGAGGAEALQEARRELEAARALAELLGAQLELEAIDAIERQLSPSRRSLTSRGAIGQPALTLTPREREVLGHLARGASNRAIAEALVISEKTVEVHVSNILGKLGATSRTHAAALAREQGLDEAA